MPHTQAKIDRCLSSISTHTQALNVSNGELAELYALQKAENASIGEATTAAQAERAVDKQNLRLVSAGSSAVSSAKNVSTAAMPHPMTQAVRITQTLQTSFASSLKNLDATSKSMRFMHKRIEGLTPRFELPLRLKNSSTIHPRTTFRLLALPRELRDEIYRELLVPGQVILPGGTVGGEARRFRFGKMPLFAIAGVNKQVRRESLKIFFQENHLVANCTRETWQRMTIVYSDRLLRRYHAGLDMIAAHLYANLTSISIAFDVRDVELNDSLSCADSTQSLHETWAQFTADQQILKTHQQQQQLHGPGTNGSPLRYWARTLRLVLRCKYLHTLGIDVSNARCTGGCCRLAQGCAEVIAISSLPSSLRKIEVVGTKTAVERTAFVLSLITSKQEYADERRAHVTAALGIKLSCRGT